MPTRAFIILSRLPDREWFSLTEAAAATGWSRGFLGGLVKSGKLASVSNSSVSGGKADKRGPRLIHLHELTRFVTDNANGLYHDVSLISTWAKTVRGWSPAVQRKLLTILEANLLRDETPAQA